MEIIRRFIAHTIVDPKKDKGRTSIFEVHLVGAILFVLHLAGRLPYEFEVEKAVRHVVLNEYPKVYGKPLRAHPRRGAWRYVVERTGSDFETVSIEEATSMSDPYPRKRKLYQRTVNHKIERMHLAACDFLDLMVASCWLQGIVDDEWNMSVYAKAGNANIPLDVDMFLPRTLSEEHDWYDERDWGVCSLPPRAAIVDLDSERAELGNFSLLPI